MHDAPKPIHEDREQDDFDEAPEAFDEKVAPDLGVMPEGNERFAPAFQGCGQLRSCLPASSPASAKRLTASGRDGGSSCRRRH